MLKLIKFWFPLVAYSGIIFYVSGLENLKPPVEGNHIDKILHLGEYIPFSFLAARCRWSINRTVSARAIFLFGVVCTLVYGISDEYHQSFVLGRDCSVYDLMADCVGGLIGAWIYLKFSRAKREDTTIY